jgi:hypothetical protein
MSRTQRPLAALPLVAVIGAGCSNAPAETGTGSGGGNNTGANHERAILAKVIKWWCRRYEWRFSSGTGWGDRSRRRPAERSVTVSAPPRTRARLD